MREHSRTQVIVAALVAVAVSLAALAHSHAHAAQQGRSGQLTSCVYCEHGVAPGPAPVCVPAPVLEREEAPGTPVAWPVRVVAVDHPGRGPPATEVRV